MSGLNKSEILAIEEAGIEKDLVKHWLSSRDDAVRESHQEAERVYESGIDIKKNFVVGSDNMDAPCNGSVAEENINCRCGLYYSKKEG